MTFEYSIPASETTVKRMFAADTLQDDCYQLIVAGDVLAVINYEQMRRYILGKVSLADILAADTNSEGQQVK